MFNLYRIPQQIYSRVENYQCTCVGGHQHHQERPKDNNHLSCNITLQGMTEQQVINFFCHETAPMESSNFEQKYLFSNQSRVFHRWMRTFMALPTAAFKIFQAIFFNALKELIEYREKNQHRPGSLFWNQFFIAAKCDLTAAWGHLITLFHTKTGINSRK